MSYRALLLECCCGEAPEQILEVGFTSDRHMVIHYWCSQCKRVAFISKTLDECRDQCPPPETPEAEALAEDARFLQSLGIQAGE